MDNIKLREKANMLLGRAQGLLMCDGFLSPVIFTISKETVTPVVINGEDISFLNDLIYELAPTCESIILITDSYVLDVTDKGDPLNIPKDLSKHPDVSESINCIIFTKETILIRQLSYIKKGNDYSFHDLGWDDLKEAKHSFQNPFKK